MSNVWYLFCLMVYFQPSLPSSLHHHRFLGKRNKKRKSIAKMCHREIVCLPNEYLKDNIIDNHELSNCYKIPRGKLRDWLYSKGLMAKIAISKFDAARKISDEIADLFKHCFYTVIDAESKSFDFVYLRCLSGTKLLTEAKVSNSFQWDGAGVLSLGRTVIYIAASPRHQLQCGTLPTLNSIAKINCDAQDNVQPCSEKV